MSRKNRLSKRLHQSLGRAVHDWKMIEQGDRILVGMSGGKDSQVLLHLLSELQKRAPIRFDLFPVHIDPGFQDSFARELEQYISPRYQPLEVIHTDVGLVAHSSENRANPCFLCSRLRRKRLFEAARDRGCKKIAFGHHKDDLIETLFINILYAGKIGTMKPRQSFFDGKLDIIRPLSYVDQDDITAYSGRLAQPVFTNPCPSAGQTKRGEVRQMLASLYRTNNHIKGNIFRAMGNIASDYLLDT